MHVVEKLVSVGVCSDSFRWQSKIEQRSHVTTVEGRRSSKRRDKVAMVSISSPCQHDERGTLEDPKNALSVLSRNALPPFNVQAAAATSGRLLACSSARGSSNKANRSFSRFGSSSTSSEQLPYNSTSISLNCRKKPAFGEICGRTRTICPSAALKVIPLRFIK